MKTRLIKDRDLLQEVGTGIYTVAPCAQTMFDKHLEQKKTTCEKEKNQKRKTLVKKGKEGESAIGADVGRGKERDNDSPAKNSS